MKVHLLAEIRSRYLCSTKHNHSPPDCDSTRLHVWSRYCVFNRMFSRRSLSPSSIWRFTWLWRQHSAVYTVNHSFTWKQVFCFVSYNSFCLIYFNECSHGSRAGCEACHMCRTIISLRPSFVCAGTWSNPFSGDMWVILPIAVYKRWNVGSLTWQY
jgi:hypothetical protein